MLSETIIRVNCKQYLPINFAFGDLENEVKVTNI